MRAEALPDVPSVGEFVPGYEVSAWYGLGAPKGTPAEVIDKINEEVNSGLVDPNIKARIADFGGTVLRRHRPSSVTSSPTKPKNGPR